MLFKEKIIILLFFTVVIADRVLHYYEVCLSTQANFRTTGEI